MPADTARATGPDYSAREQAQIGDGGILPASGSRRYRSVVTHLYLNSCVSSSRTCGERAYLSILLN